MSLYDLFANSIAGMQAARRALDRSAEIVADPRQWGIDSGEPSGGASFAGILAGQMGGTGQSREGETGNSTPPVTGAPPGYAPLAGLGVGQSEGPQDIMDAIITALIAEKMYAANARLFAIENKIAGIIIHLGEEHPPADP